MTRRRKSALIRNESGQSLVVVVLSIGLVIAVAAFAIDVGMWLARHHQAQVTADAAALAAANYMSTGGSAPTATTYATTYASDNHISINASDVTVDTGAKTVSVRVPTTGALVFAGIALGSGPNILARAVANWGFQDCTSAGSGCAFMYAADDICPGDTGVQIPSTTGSGNQTVNHGITIAKVGVGSTTGISGDVISASDITTNVNSGQIRFNSVARYAATDANGNNCTSFGGPTPTNPNPYTAIYQKNLTSNAYPIDYRLIYPACGTAGDLCVNSFPSFCTPADEWSSATPDTVNTINTNDIYCDAGTGNPNDPSTWNGTINVNSGGNATFIAGAVNFSLPSNSTLGPAAGNRLLAYGADCNATRPPSDVCPATATTTTTSPAVSLTSGGNATVNGDMFAPAGVIFSNLGGTPSITGFLEGWDAVYYANGTVTAQGPPVTSNGTFEADHLVQ